MPKHIFMTGMGGIGMSALAQALSHNGAVVGGSDREESPTTHLLQQKDISVLIGQDADNIPAYTELLIYSDAIPSDNVERVSARERGIPELSYFEALGEFSKNARTIAVAGTHGKTTTTGMLAKILVDGGANPTAIIGSIVKDFGSNFVAGDSTFAEASPDKPNLFVVEACEYRDHLLKLSPEILVITNIELDHTDYFPTLSAVQDTFRKAAEKVPVHGFIITNPQDRNIEPVLQNVSARVIDYTQMAIGEISLIGEFNRMNARAALAAAHKAYPTLSLEAGVHSLSQFKGSWRRFEYRGETPQGAHVYDDYAHHPTAIEKTIQAARQKFPDKHIVVAFHPHLYSRTKSLIPEFATALATADTTIIAPIYAAREEHDPTVSNHILADDVKKLGGNAFAIDSFDEIRDRLLEEKEDSLIITMGAGDIYKVAEQIAD